MPITDKAAEIAQLTRQAGDDSKTPQARITACRYLLRLTDRSDRAVRVAKRIAKRFQNDENVTPKVREKAGRLLNYAIGHEDADRDDDESEKPSSRFVEVLKTAPKKTHAEFIADLNKGWDAEKPVKWLYGIEASDLVPYGIPDLHEPNTKYFMEPSEVPGKLPFRLINPKYIVAYEAWKANRFPNGLPDKRSSWVLRFEESPFGADQQPRPYSVFSPDTFWGHERRVWEYQHGLIQRWEEPFARELCFEILCGNGRPGFISDADVN